MVLLYMVTWIPSIYPPMLAYIPDMVPMGIYIRILIMMCHTYNKNADSEYDSTNYAFLICEV